MVEAPIFHFNDERSSIVSEVVSRVTRSTPNPLFALNNAAYTEIKRLEQRPGSERNEYLMFREIARNVGRMSDDERRRRVETLALHYASDIAGNFNPRVFSLSTKVLPRALAMLLAPSEFASGLRSAALLDKHIVTQGPLDDIRAISKKATVVFVPTHLSNLDSVVFGFALEREGLPPATYGAGKNLFTNPFLSYFMQNLGAYRVDRRIKHDLYKEVLKTYSCVLLERGYHSLFFPGGTRCRSGAVEEKLKLGLLGTGVEAYVQSLRRSREQRVVFVPATINYLLTLEAETLIEDYLAEIGKHRYIIEDDESTQIERVVTLVRRLVKNSGSVVIRFGQPMDPFTNHVTADTRSIDHRGRTVNPASYVTRDGKYVQDEQRDAQYTRELGVAICDSYAKDTVLLPTHFVAGAAFQKLKSVYPGADLFSLLRHRDEVLLAMDEFVRLVQDLTDHARTLEDRGNLVLGPGVRAMRPDTMIAEAIKAFDGYHQRPVLAPAEGGYMLSDPNLLFYYQNRLAVSGLGYHPAGGRSR